MFQDFAVHRSLRQEPYQYLQTDLQTDAVRKQRLSLSRGENSPQLIERSKHLQGKIFVNL